MFQLLLSLHDHSRYDLLSESLLVSVRQGHVDITELLLQISKLSQEFLQKLLHAAAACGHIRVAKRLVMHGATGFNWGLRFAATNGHVDVVHYMIELGACNWNSGLSSAVRSGRGELVQLMLDRGASNWEAALIEAIRTQKMECVFTLILFVAPIADVWPKCMVDFLKRPDSNHMICDLYATKRANREKLLHQLGQFVISILDTFDAWRSCARVLLVNEQALPTHLADWLLKF